MMRARAPGLRTLALAAVALAAMALGAAGVAALAAAGLPDTGPVPGPREASTSVPSPADEVVVGSKKFTEAVILGEIAAGALRQAGLPAEHRRELGGTRVLFEALRSGAIDVYAEYTGTLREEILAGRDVESEEALRTALAGLGLRMTAPLGFDNSYAIAVRAQVADSLGLERISDLRAHPGLDLGLTNEFLDRADGWPGLRRRYGLPGPAPRGLDHDLAYRAIGAGEIDAMDVYTTDAEIEFYGLRPLEDDLGWFRSYEAVFLYRADLAERAPGAEAALAALAGTLDAPRMRRLNARVKLEGESEAAVAADVLSRILGAPVAAAEDGFRRRLWLRTVEHLFLVGVSLAMGILAAIPLGILAFRRPRLGQGILGAVGVIQTIPALALLVFMIPLFGIYAPPAIAALFLYSLLPIVRNTHAGLAGIPPDLEESAEALDLSPRDRLLRIELPLASPSILAGIQTAAVLNIGFATLGALIGAGGYGQPILTGIRLDDTLLILEGAVPAALLAIAAQVLLGALEKRLVPRGLRLERAT
ncbi:MAG: glycine betaine ABC transporter substrate-binding protein [Gemmatimonadota bacterium]|nr:glycine betaine ABC transporter substrate-binding protein [Gemmatimonadota bacterium]